MLWVLLAAGALARSPGTPEVGRWDSVGQAMAAARQAERDGVPAAEWEACEAVVAFGSDRQKRACEKRIDVLDDYRDSDGGFDDLAALEQARRVADADKPAAFAAIEGDEARVAPVRAAAATWLLKEAIDAGQLDAAEVLSDQWWSPDAADQGLVALGLPERDARRHARLRVRLRFAQGRTAEAQAIEALLNPASARAPAVGELDTLVRDRTRGRMGVVGRVVLGLWALLAVPLGAAGWLRGPRPLPAGLVPLAVVGLGGLGLAGLWAPEVVAPFAGLLGLFVAMHLVAVGAAVSLRGRRMLAGAFGVGTAVATVAAGAVVLDLAKLWAWVGL